MTDYSGFFDLILKIGNMLVRWGEELWHFLTYDMHNVISAIPEGTPFYLILPVIGILAIIIRIII